jgi:hypothetical protein
MVHLLVRNAPVVLQHVVVRDALCNGNLLRHREHFRELVVGDVVQFRAVVFGDDELGDALDGVENAREGGGGTECPRERGPMSRNANVFSDSKIFIDGISPATGLAIGEAWIGVRSGYTLDDLAEDTCS